ncbi:EAL domain-containing protein [Kineobactrum salinum]|uniref:cyclic-guanylate-specific phosphodiesterase n=1 Tax=Kineobactrum salinum TaxID=2708301 RepID=A0A6C0U5R1_9GAMM|nr:EAL domain-containing protein [Kineobactrum salinum]QIB65745.1 EAL domain-containing protein [Kineobactrum salinum]
MATILIVDDHADSREFLVTLLGYRDHVMLEAADGLEALTVVRDRHPDLVVADVLMPTMDGYEFVMQLRADPDIARTPVIFYTATYHEREALSLARSCGVSDVLTKPSEPGIVLATVDRVLGEVVTPSLPQKDELDRRHLRLMTDKLKLVSDDLGVASQRYAALIDINLQLASERDPRRLLDSLCRIARELIGAGTAMLAVRDKNGDGSLYLSSSGLDPEVAQKLSLPSMQAGIFGDVIGQRKARRLPNPGGDPLTVGLPATYPAAYSLLAVPVMSLAHTYGWICLCDRLGGGGFSEEDENLLGILAAQAGRIYENGSLYLSLKEQEERFRQLAENIRDVFWLVSTETGEDIYISPAYDQVWGLPRQQGRNSLASLRESVHPDDREKIPPLLSDLTVYDTEYRVVRPDGSIRWIHDRGFPVRNAESQVYRFAGVAEDITSRKINEEKFARLTRIHTVLSQINSTIVRIHDRQALFEEACRIVVEHGRFGMAWIGTLDSETQAVTPGAQAAKAVEDEADRMLRTAQAQDEDSQGILREAIQRAKPTYCNDITPASGGGTWRRLALARGYHSVVVLPLFTHATVVGVFVLYATERNFFDANERSLLTELANDISFALEYIEKTEQASYLAYYDNLTGLSNRVMFHERLGQFIKTSERERERLAVLIVDLDRFKTVNDTLGRQAGDALIRELAQRLRVCVAEPVQLARAGADQFAMVLPDLKHAGEIARLIEGRLKECLEEPFLLDGEELRVSAKVGISLYPEDGRDAEALFLNAEMALKKAKSQGKRYLFFDRNMSESVAQNLGLENRLRRALANEEFLLHYQPKVDLVTGVISGMEALIRWQSPDEGLIPPLQFIPLLEETGLILDVGHWVLERAAADLRSWQEQGVEVPGIAVNVSALQLRQADFVRQVKGAIQQGGSRLTLDLELTESMVMSDVEDSLVKLRELRELGLGVAIDDFGTGYSSLSYIARLPIDVIKIDRSFIVKMIEHPDDMMIVSTIITMAHNMRLKVVAEGVDSTDQVDILHGMGCDEMQGYLFSKPVPALEMLGLLRRGARFER